MLETANGKRRLKPAASRAEQNGFSRFKGGAPAIQAEGNYNEPHLGDSSGRLLVNALQTCFSMQRPHLFKFHERLRMDARARAGKALFWACGRAVPLRRLLFASDCRCLLKPKL